jgi:nucleotide-binding universal stress UspA family protein
MYKKILGPFDGSKLAECSLDHIKAIATGCQVPEVTLLTVLEPIIAPFAVGLSEQQAIEGANKRQKAEEEDKQKAQEYLAKAANYLKKDGVLVQTDVISPGLHIGVAESILDYAQSNKVDLIVMSSHGRSGVSRLAFGSVAEKVGRLARVPVLTIASPGCRL